MYPVIEQILTNGGHNRWFKVDKYTGWTNTSSSPFYNTGNSNNSDIHENNKDNGTIKTFLGFSGSIYVLYLFNVSSYIFNVACNAMEVVSLINSLPVIHSTAVPEPCMYIQAFRQEYGG